MTRSFKDDFEGFVIRFAADSFAKLEHSDVGCELIFVDSPRGRKPPSHRDEGFN